MTEALNPDCDVAVIGGGPAGIAAACVAAEAGRRVVLLDENPEPGGQIWRRDIRHAAPPLAARWLARLSASGARVVSEASVVSARFDHGISRFVIVAEHGTSPQVISAGRIVLATGARERFLPFPGWTLPGVLGIGGAQALLKGGMDVAHRRVLIAGSGPLLLPVAASMARAGAHVLGVCEQAPAYRVLRFTASLSVRPSLLAQAVRYRVAFARAPYRTGTWIAEARRDGEHIVAMLTDGARERPIHCDLLCVAFGLVPNTEVARQLGCATRGGCIDVDEDQRTSLPNVFCAGEPAGIGGVELALAEGEVAGSIAAGVMPSGGARRARARLRVQAARMHRAFALRDELRALPAADTIVCRCEDVPFGAMRSAWAPRQAKLYTRAGMGPCQGRICGAALHYLFDWDVDSVRPPVEPARVETLIAGAALVAADSHIASENT